MRGATCGKREAMRTRLVDDQHQLPREEPGLQNAARSVQTWIDTGNPDTEGHDRSVVSGIGGRGTLLERNRAAVDLHRARVVVVAIAAQNGPIWKVRTLVVAIDVEDFLRAVRNRESVKPVDLKKEPPCLASG